MDLNIQASINSAIFLTLTNQNYDLVTITERFFTQISQSTDLAVALKVVTRKCQDNFIIVCYSIILFCLIFLKKKPSLNLHLILMNVCFAKACNSQHNLSYIQYIYL